MQSDAGRVLMRIKALVVHEKNGPYCMEDVELDEPKDNEVLVRNVASGICHTDEFGRSQGVPIALPLVLGHEGAGIVERVGANVDDLKPGDHVGITYAFDGTCPACQAHEPYYCENFNQINFGGVATDGTTRLHQNGHDVSMFFGQSSFATYSVANAASVCKVVLYCPQHTLVCHDHKISRRAALQQPAQRFHHAVLQIIKVFHRGSDLEGKQIVSPPGIRLREIPLNLSYGAAVPAAQPHLFPGFLLDHRQRSASSHHAGDYLGGLPRPAKRAGIDAGHIHTHLLQTHRRSLRLLPPQIAQRYIRLSQKDLFVVLTSLPVADEEKTMALCKSRQCRSAPVVQKLQHLPVGRWGVHIQNHTLAIHRDPLHLLYVPIRHSLQAAGSLISKNFLHTISGDIERMALLASINRNGKPSLFTADHFPDRRFAEGRTVHRHKKHAASIPAGRCKPCLHRGEHARIIVRIENSGDIVLQMGGQRLASMPCHHDNAYNTGCTKLGKHTVDDRSPAHRQQRLEGAHSGRIAGRKNDGCVVGCFMQRTLCCSILSIELQKTHRLTSILSSCAGL